MNTLGTVTVTQSFTESDSFQFKDNSLATICDKACQKQIFDNRSLVMQQGLQGDSGLQMISSLNDIAVISAENNENRDQSALRKENQKKNFRQQNEREDVNNYLDPSHFKYPNFRDSVNQHPSYNQKGASPNLNASGTSNESKHNKQNNQEGCNIKDIYKKGTLSVSSEEQENDMPNSPFANKFMKFFENSTLQQQPVSIIEKQKDKQASLEVFNQQPLGGKHKKRMNDQISRMVQVKLYTLEFIKRLKLLKNNRRIDSTTPEQIEIIQDLSYYQKETNLQKTNPLMKCLDNLCTRLSFIPVFIPTNKVRILWDKFTLFYLYTFFFCFSIIIFFNQSDPNTEFISIFCVITLFVMISDVFIEMNTAFFQKDGVVLDRNLIIKEYMLSLHFMTDFTSFFVLCSRVSLKSDNIAFNPDNDIWEYLYILISFSKFYGVSLKRKRLENVLTFKFYAKSLYRLFSQVFSVLQIAHIASIGWYSLTFIKSNSTNWLQHIHIENAPYYQKYIYSVYWAITTMTTVGYGDITATNSTEALYISISMIIFSVVFAYSINNIGSILQDIEQSSKKLKDNIQIIEKYLNRKNVNIQLKTRVIQYLHFQNEEEKTKSHKEEEEILSVLSKKLREEITLEANSQIIKKFDIFKGFSEETLKKLVFIMKEIIVSPNEIIFQEGECFEKSIYLIQSGRIQILQCDIQKQEGIPSILKTLINNDIFGEIAFFSQLPRQATAKSVNLSTLYKIDRNDFIDLIKHNKKDYEVFQMIQHNILFNGDYKQICTKCFSCKKNGHIARQCPYIHQSFDASFLSLRSNYSVFQERKLFIRPYSRQFKAKILVELNKSLVNKLRTEFISEIKNLSIFELSQQEQPITNIEIEEYQRFMEEDIISSDVSRISNANKNLFIEQTSIVKNHGINEQQKNKNQILSSISSRCIIKEKPDLNKLQINTDKFILDKDHQECTLNLIDDPSPKHVNSNNDICSTFKNDVQTQASKMTIQSRNKPPTILKNLNNLDLNQNDQSKLISKVNSFIELESINVSANLACESLHSTEQKYHRQLSSQMALQLQPEDKKTRNNQSKSNSNAGQQKISNQNLILNEIAKQMSSSNLEREDESRSSKPLNPEQLSILQKEFHSQLNKSIKTVSSNSAATQGSMIIPDQQKIVQKLSKILDIDNKLLQAAVRNNNRKVTHQRSMVQQLFLYDFDSMSLFNYYFPKSNYDKVIKQFNYNQLKKLKEQKITRLSSLKQRRPNICIRSSPEANHQILYLNYLSILKSKQTLKQSNQGNPTNISYGVSLKSCNKFPSKFTNNNISQSDC